MPLYLVTRIKTAPNYTRKWLKQKVIYRCICIVNTVQLIYKLEKRAVVIPLKPFKNLQRVQFNLSCYIIRFILLSSVMFLIFVETYFQTRCWWRKSKIKKNFFSNLILIRIIIKILKVSVQLDQFSCFTKSSGKTKLFFLILIW